MPGCGQLSEHNEYLEKLVASKTVLPQLLKPEISENLPFLNQSSEKTQRRQAKN